ncbi:MAG TPA: glycosyltransferase family A protein [Bacteroidia bacterium]|nr:glycosyltransferase family A protein [Bacteroidia bacterium]
MLVTVIITAHNYARYIERAIRSVQNQSLPREQYEIIVIDDCSTDETPQVLENYKDEVRVFRMEKNVGLAEARNFGIKKAKGQYVLFVDADDYIQYDLLKVQSVFLTENNRLDAVAVDYYLVNEFGDHLEWVSAQEKPIACGVMFRKDRLFDVGLYDTSFRAREDEDMRIRFLKKFNIYNIILPLYRYRRHNSNLTNNAEEMEKYRQKLDEKHNGNS